MRIKHKAREKERLRDGGKENEVEINEKQKK